MSRRRNKAQRGFTLADMLSGMFVLAILTGFAVSIITPLLSAPNAQAAKINTVQSGAMALYRLQRDIREGQVNGVYVCTYPAPSTCSTPSSAPTMASAQVIAILSPQSSGTGYTVWGTAGTPAWQGFQVFWLVSDGSGNGTYNLEYAFGQSTGFQPGASAASADTAVTSALQATSPEIVAQNILSMSLDQNVTAKTIGLSLSSQSTVDSKVNESTYEGDSFARN